MYTIRMCASSFSLSRCLYDKLVEQVHSGPNFAEDLECAAWTDHGAKGYIFAQTHRMAMKLCAHVDVTQIYLCANSQALSTSDSGDMDIRVLSGSKKRGGAKKKTYGTSDSHVVPHHSTNEALSSLTLQIGRDAVIFAWYGRRWKGRNAMGI